MLHLSLIDSHNERWLMKNVYALWSKAEFMYSSCPSDLRTGKLLHYKKFIWKFCVAVDMYLTRMCRRTKNIIYYQTLSQLLISKKILLLCACNSGFSAAEIKSKLCIGPSVPQHAVRQLCSEGVPEGMCTWFDGFANHGAAAVMDEQKQPYLWVKRP